MDDFCYTLDRLWAGLAIGEGHPAYEAWVAALEKLAEGTDVEVRTGFTRVAAHELVKREHATAEHLLAIFALTLGQGPPEERTHAVQSNYTDYLPPKPWSSR